MKAVLMVLMVVFAAFGATTVVAGHTAAVAPGPQYMTDMELSIDNGTPQNAWTYYANAGAYVGVDYTQDTTVWHLTGIKYAIHTTWPTGTFEGMGVCSFDMSGGVPGSIVWPTDGTPIYNDDSSGTPGDPGTGYKWINQAVDPAFTVAENFMVAITMLYAYPNCDAIAVDDTGAGSHDWTYYSGTWDVAGYGKTFIRALITDVAVEPTTMGMIRTMYR